MRDCAMVTVLGRKDTPAYRGRNQPTPPIYGTAANSGDLSERGAGVVTMAVEDRRLDQFHAGLGRRPSPRRSARCGRYVEAFVSGSRTSAGASELVVDESP
jgi:hypothetical protein